MHCQGIPKSPKKGLRGSQRHHETHKKNEESKAMRANKFLGLAAVVSGMALVAAGFSANASAATATAKHERPQRRGAHAPQRLVHDPIVAAAGHDATV